MKRQACPMWWCLPLLQAGHHLHRVVCHLHQWWKPRWKTEMAIVNPAVLFCVPYLQGYSSRYYNLLHCTNLKNNIWRHSDSVSTMIWSLCQIFAQRRVEISRWSKEETNLRGFILSITNQREIHFECEKPESNRHLNTATLPSIWIR